MRHKLPASLREGSLPHHAQPLPVKEASSAAGASAMAAAAARGCGTNRSSCRSLGHGLCRALPVHVHVHCASTGGVAAVRAGCAGQLLLLEVVAVSLLLLLLLLLRVLRVLAVDRVRRAAQARAGEGSTAPRRPLPLRAAMARGCAGGGQTLRRMTSLQLV